MFHQSKKSIKMNITNTNRSTDVTRHSFASQSRFSVLNYDKVSDNVLDHEINIFNVRKTKHNNRTRPIQNMVHNSRRPPVVVNNSPENQHHFCRLKKVQEKTRTVTQ